MESNQHRFEELQLMPGQVLQLEFGGYSSQRERSVLLGFSPGRSIIVTTPRINGISVPISIDDTCNVRFFASRLNGACAFSSTVIHMSTRPYAHLHLAMPAHIELGEVRKSLRASVSLVASIRLDSGERASATIVDLSTDGARIQCQKLRAESGDDCIISCKCSVADVDRVLNMPATIRSLQESDGEIAYGLQFHDVDDVDRIALHAYVLTTLQLPRTTGSIAR